MSLEKEKQEFWKNVFRSVLNQIEKIEMEYVYSDEEEYMCCDTIMYCDFRTVYKRKEQEVVGAFAFICRECDSWMIDSLYLR